MNDNVPREARDISAKLSAAGFKAYLVGGCVRDLLIERAPKDWDIATDARPEQIQAIFPESVYENSFGTVAVKTESDEDTLKIIEVTTFRSEGAYSDSRRPDEVNFVSTIEEDLARRDFTVNAMALDLGDLGDVGDVGRKAGPAPAVGEITDPFEGAKDIARKLIRAVGDPNERFREDALRLMRAVRLAAELGFRIEDETRKAIRANAAALKHIAAERVRDEFLKIVASEGAAKGVQELEDLGLLAHIVPELREAIGVTQNLHHVYTVWEHLLRSLDYAASERYPLSVRLAVLLHDIGKPKTKQGEGPNSTFYNHAPVGARMTRAIMERLHFPVELARKIEDLVRHHMFKADEEITEAAVRRIIRAVGAENVWELVQVRTADRIGSGVPKAWPYRLRSYMALIEKNLREPTSLKQMVLKGDRLMEILDIKPGPRVGWILYALFEEVLDDPAKNSLDYLEARAKELGALPDAELQKLAERGKEELKSALEEEEGEIKKKFGVR